MPKAKHLPSPSRGLRLCLSLALLLLGLFTSQATEFDTANQAYDQGKFGEAKSGYEKMIETGAASANVYYNLGNTDFRLGSAGRAILDYERSLALNPRHPEARANLKLLREKTGAKLLPLSWDEEIASRLPSDIWSVLAALTAWLILFTLVLIFTSRRRDQVLRGTVALLCAFLCVSAIISLHSIAHDQTLGVITAQETEARLAPAESAGVAESLPAGSQVRVLSERGAWIYCELPSSGRGWIPDGAVDKVRPEHS